MIQEKISRQKEFFKTNQPKELRYRIHYLKQLKITIQEKEEQILEALAFDLEKSAVEAYSSEVGFILESIDNFLKNIKKWAKPKRKLSPLFMPISKSKIYYEPHGLVLIIGPFNYPFQLVIEPMIGALAAGNTCILKPSEKTPQTTAVIKEIIQAVFPAEYVDVVTGGKEVVTELIHSDLNYIFFTGSNQVGQIIMQAAAKRLIPVTLELGGKSPTIIHKDADIEKAAARIVWGKFYNAGQTCIAPDYLYVHHSIQNQLLDALEKKIIEFYGDEPIKSPDYGRIIDGKEFNRLLALIDFDKVYYGAEQDRERLKIGPTILTGIDWSDPVMQEEIFGPILPVLTYEDIQATLSIIKDKPRPLAFYLFTEDSSLEAQVINDLPFGGGCINDTISHVTSPRLPFGGTGQSGMGNYHGEASFYTFSHAKSIMKKSTLFDITAIYPPYKNKLNFIKKLLN